MQYRTFFFVILSLLCVALPINLHAQEPGKDQYLIVEALHKKTDEIAASLDKITDNDQALAAAKIELTDIAAQLRDESNAIATRINDINGRLEQIGTASATDAAIVNDERNRLTQEKSTLHAVQSEASDTIEQTSRLTTQISDLRRDLFKNTLSRRVDITYNFGSEVWKSASVQTAVLGKVILSWWSSVMNGNWVSVLTAALFSLCVAVFFNIGARYIIGNLYRRDPQNLSPTYMSRLSVAFWSTVVPSAAVAAFFGTIYLYLDYFQMLRSDVAPIFGTFFLIVSFIYFIHRLGLAVFSPNMPHWRLIAVAPRAGRALAVLTTATAIVSGLDFLFTEINVALSSPLSLTIAQSLIAAVLIGLLILRIAFVRAIEVPQTGERKRWPRPVQFFLVAIGILPIVTALAGYVGLARFLTQQIVVTGAFLATMYLGFLFARAISEEQAFMHSSFGRMLKERLNLDDRMVDQLGLVAGMLINVVVVLIGVPLVLLQFGFQWNELQKGFLQLLTGFQIGNFSISLAGIAGGVVLFIVVYALTRWFQHWLDRNVMARGGVDSGVRNSIRTVVGYVGLFLAALIGISAAGFNMSNLALIAGGLSLGIGFGLQNIVQNFVSGLILLAERPFKVGDWVEAGSVSGIVKKISVRATEIETFQRQSITVPNSTLINGNVGNWTHHNKLGRIDINVQVPYTSDPRRIYELLLEVVRANTSVLKNPAPSVSFSSMTNTLMAFDIYAHLPDITSSSGVKNELRFAVVERLAQEGVNVAPSLDDIVNVPMKAGQILQAVHDEQALAEDRAKTTSRKATMPGKDEMAKES